MKLKYKKRKKIKIKIKQERGRGSCFGHVTGSAIIGAVTNRANAL
jgi:hypothetical protein